MVSKAQMIQFALFAAVLFVDQATKAYLPTLTTTSRLSLVGSAIALGVLVVLYLQQKTTLEKTVLGMLAGAGISNMVDVILYSHVRDVFHVQGLYFNIADVVLVVSAGVLAVAYVRHHPSR